MNDTNCLVYVISLKEAVLRRYELAQRFPVWFPKMIICEAVNGRIITAEQYFRLVKHSYAKYARIMTPSEVGCALSHKNVWEHFLKSEAKYALIFEDDVIGNDSDINTVLRLLALINQKISPYFVWLCGGMDGLPTNKVLCRKTPVCGVFEIPTVSRRYVYRTVSYVISHESARVLLAKQSSDLHLADDWQRLLARSGLKLFYSHIFHHPVERTLSEIERERTEVQNVTRKNVFRRFLSSVYHSSIACGGFILGYKTLSSVIEKDGPKCRT